MGIGFGGLYDWGGDCLQDDLGDCCDDCDEFDFCDLEGLLYEYEGLVGVVEVVGEVDFECFCFWYQQLLFDDDVWCFFVVFCWECD